MSTSGKSQVLHSVQCVERGHIARCIADLLQLSHFGTRASVSRKNERKEPGLGALRVPPGTCSSSRHRYSAAGGGVVQKGAAAPLRGEAPSPRYHLAPGVHFSSPPTLLDPSYLTGYDRPAGRASLFIGRARRARSLRLAVVPATRRRLPPTSASG